MVGLRVAGRQVSRLALLDQSGLRPFLLPMKVECEGHARPLANGAEKGHALGERASGREAGLSLRGYFGFKALLSLAKKAPLSASFAGSDTGDELGKEDSEDIDYKQDENEDNEDEAESGAQRKGRAGRENGEEKTEKVEQQEHDGAEDIEGEVEGRAEGTPLHQVVEEKSSGTDHQEGLDGPKEI